MRVLVASQEFKGSLGAVEACEAIARGIGAARPDWSIDLLPLSDGGPGFLDALSGAVAIDIREARVRDALGRPRMGRYGLAAGGEEAFIEAAEANGLSRIAPGERDALAATSAGVGNLIAAATAHGPRRVTVGVGGSATSDGGAGMAAALGARLLDRRGRVLGAGVRPLLELDRIEWDARRSRDTTFVVAADVQNPLVGRDGAAAVYGPQKGAGPAAVAIIEAALARYAAVLLRDLGADVAALPGAGAAGGLAAGLIAFLGARLVSGFDVVATATGLEGRAAAADFVATGEGSYDAQSAAGKGPARVVALARALGRRWVLFAGRTPAKGDGIVALSDIEPDEVRSMARAAELLAEAARRWALQVA